LTGGKQNGKKWQAKLRKKISQAPLARRAAGFQNCRQNHPEAGAKNVAGVGKNVGE